MKLKSYERPTLYLLELCTEDIMSTSTTVPEEPAEPENTTPTFGPVDGGGF